MQQRLDIGFIGYPGSGKSTAGDYLEERYGFIQITGSDLLDQHALKLGRILSTREDYHDFYAKMRKQFGNDFIASAGLATSGDKVAHVGVRTIADTERFLGAGAVLLGIACKRPIRFARTAGTSEKYPTDILKFAQADLLEDSLDKFGPQVARVMEEAHHIINNDGDREELFAQIDDIVDIYL